MQKIISSVPREALVAELTEDKFVRMTSLGNNKIYIINHHNSPNVMREIGRLRELSFRDGGGGTGKEADIDSYDTAQTPYQQLIVWDEAEREITGGYRFFNLKDVSFDENKKPILATTKLFQLSDKFIENYLPITMELGRSFVQPKYQSTKVGRKAIYSLDNLWDGLATLVVNNPQVEYFFGKVTMYTHYDIVARDILLHFFKQEFPDKEKLLCPHKPIEIETSKTFLDSLFTGENYKENYKILSKEIRQRGEVIPPIINAYMGLSRTPKIFGTAINHNFGGVEETAILMRINEIHEVKKKRYIASYLEQIAENKK